MGRKQLVDGKKARKRSAKPNKTTLWYVYLCLSDKTVYVSNYPARSNIPACNDEMRIRTISGNAAGRKYIRDNLLFRLAKWDVEDRYPMCFSPKHTVDFIDKDDLKRAKVFMPKDLRVKVIKQ